MVRFHRHHRANFVSCAGHGMPSSFPLFPLFREQLNATFLSASRRSSTQSRVNSSASGPIPDSSPAAIIGPPIAHANPVSHPGASYSPYMLLPTHVKKSYVGSWLLAVFVTGCGLSYYFGTHFSDYSSLKTDVKTLTDDVKTLKVDVNGRFDSLKVEVNGRFDAVNGRFDAINMRFDALFAALINPEQAKHALAATHAGEKANMATGDVRDVKPQPIVK